jgi:Ca-activated chloride channel family protein
MVMSSLVGRPSGARRQPLNPRRYSAGPESGRPAPRRLWCRSAKLAGAALLVVVIAIAQLGAHGETPFSVQITSPLGRTGVAGAVRIVARVSHEKNVTVQTVRFFVNDRLVGEDPNGPVYAVEWTDDNPFAATAIAVEAIDAAGRTVRDTVKLEPFEFIETAEVLSVLLEATVQDATGRFVAGMSDTGFVLTEDGVRQRLDVVRPEVLPATYTLLVDSSNSMARRVDFLREAAARLSTHLRPQDRMLVVPFSRTLGPITGPTSDKATVAEAVTAIQPRGGTAIADALSDTAKLIGGIEGRHAIVLLTDGYDEHSKASLESALVAVQSTGATVYVIGVGGVAGISLKGERLLKQIAAATGGRAFFPSREEELPTVHDRVASDVANRYLLTYTPSNQRVDGAWRAVSLATADPLFKVRVKPGYFAPKPPPVRPTIEFTVTGMDRDDGDITRDDLTLVEDGVSQSIDTFHEVTAAVSIVMAIDESGSMRPAAEAVKAAARSFVGALRDSDKLAVMRFADRAELVHDLTLFRSEALKAIDDYTPRGGTALFDALHGALARLTRVEGRRVVVLLTDGRDENNAGTGPGSLVRFEEVLGELREANAIVYTIALGSRVDQPRLEQIARESGGEAYFPALVDDLARDYARIVENIRRRYVVGYTSTNSTRNGAWRAVEIRARQEGARVTSRGGYFAPDK